MSHFRTLEIHGKLSFHGKYPTVIDLKMQVIIYRVITAHMAPVSLVKKINIIS
jgi:hypothetical protein